MLSLDDASLVVTDPSGELFSATSGSFKKKGYLIQVMHLSEPRRSIHFNPLANLSDPIQMEEIAHILVQSASPEGSSSDPFWNQGAEAIISTMISTLAAQKNPHYMNLANVMHLLQNLDAEGSLLDPLVSLAPEHVYQQYRSFFQGNIRTFQSQLSTAQTSLKALANPMIAELTSHNELCFESMRKRKTILYIIAPSERLSYFSFLISLIFTQLFHTLMRQLPKSGDLPVYCLLEEAGHYAIPNLATILSTIRKFGVSVSLVLQSISQLQAHYGINHANTILNGGIATRLVLS